VAAITGEISLICVIQIPLSFDFWRVLHWLCAVPARNFITVEYTEKNSYKYFIHHRDHRERRENIFCFKAIPFGKDDHLRGG
jgi:hypothetical protein